MLDDTLDEVLDDDAVIDPEEDEEVENVRPEADIPRYRKSSCPKSKDGHKAIANPKKRGRYDAEYACEHCGKTDWTGTEIEELLANALLKEDSNRELCRICEEEHGFDSLPYGEETGEVEWMPQYAKDGSPILDSEDNLLYVAYPELKCEHGHRWYKGEGKRRSYDGPNKILLESHMYSRKRRELLAADGVVDPAFTMDRWGKRPIHGLYYRSHPQGRKTNTPEQRRDGGTGFYK